MLERSGYTVPAIASSGAEAIQKATEIGPDLVLMDISLQGAMDGVDTAVHIHRQLGLPVIYLTGNADNETLERAKMAEPAGYLLKPVGVQDLHGAITMALHNAQIRKEASARVQGTAATRQDGADAEANPVRAVELSSAAEDLWQATVNYFERWTAYDEAVRGAESTRDGGGLEEAVRILVVLAENELRHAMEVFREGFAHASGDSTAVVPKTARNLWSASEQYFRELATRDELTRKFQQRKTRTEDVERACTLVKFAQERLREAAINFRYSTHLASWATA